MAKKKKDEGSTLADGFDNLYFEEDPAPRVATPSAVVPDPAPDEEGSSETGASSPISEEADHPRTDEPESVTLPEMADQEEQS